MFFKKKYDIDIESKLSNHTTSIDELRSEISKARGENALLRAEIDALKTNVSSLRNSINRKGIKTEEEKDLNSGSPIAFR